MVFLGLTWLVLALPGAGVPPPVAAGAPWERAHDRLRERAERMAGELERTRVALIERAAGDAAALARLLPQPVALRRSGYGIVPEIVADESPSVVEPPERFFSLERLGRDGAADFDDAARLVRRATAGPGEPIEPLIDELERLHLALESLEDHLGYHAYWQRAVLDFPEFFAERNRIVADVRAVEALRASGASAPEIARRQARILERLAPFRATPGLALASGPDGTRELPVTVVTDIGDERFLDGFRAAVEAAFVHSAAARAHRFRVDLRLRRVAPAELYPEGPPASGEPIDVRAHLDRFPRGALVLTTGEQSTHAWPGRSIVLGPEPLGPSTLAHEFAHLLGFRDAYLRGYDGAPTDRFGVVMVEWSGLRDDLMGDATGGPVTSGMIETLVRAYDRP